MKTIYLVRHGQTDWNVLRRMQGHSDIPLNEVGKLQAESLIEFFKNQDIELIYSSDLSRARETANIVSSSLGLTPFLDPRLREVFLGSMEGLTKDEIIAQLGEDSWNRWGSNLINDFSFKWPESESRIEQVLRFKDIFSELLTRAEKKIAVVTHGLALRTFIHYLHPNLSEPVAIPNCVIYKLEYTNNTWSSPIKVFEAP